MRKCGVLMPIFALPSEYGIGCFSKEACDFADMLKQAGQSMWQILPLGPTGYGDSPYQSFSTFAGNPYFIDLEQLQEEGLLYPKECRSLKTPAASRIDYQSLYETRFSLLHKAFSRSNCRTDREYQEFCREQEDWLEDYALFMAVKQHFDGSSWDRWEEGIRFRDEAAMAAYRELLADEIEYYRYLQFLFTKQWIKLKKYVNNLHIEVIGDIPIYAAPDSADVWAHPKLFQLNRERLPVAVAGCPPDGFSDTGQLWGNPLYDWEVHQREGYRWWIQRIAYCLRLYDVVRIDHFRGFDQYYSIPYGEETACNGTWKQGPGFALFQALQAALGSLPIIAEDLGFLTPSVIGLLEDCGYPGMKVLQFAFDSREDSDYLPHNYQRNCVVYTGTHDNDTLQGWYGSIREEDRRMVDLYTNGQPADKIHWALISLAMGSVADTCIIPVQDFLGLSSEGRMNTPSILGGNWQWRMAPNAFSPSLVKRIRAMTEVYGRCGF